MPGADDYLVKPFDLAELSARIGSVARRYSGNPNPIDHPWAAGDRPGRAQHPSRRQARPADGAGMGAVRGVSVAPGPASVEGAAGREALCLRRRGREQHDRGPCQPPAQEAGEHGHRDRARHGLPAGHSDEAGRAAFRRGLVCRWALVLTVLWLLAASVTAVIVRDEMDEVFDSALRETAERILPLAVTDIVGREEQGVTQRLARDPRARRVLHLPRARRRGAHPAAVPCRRPRRVPAL